MRRIRAGVSMAPCSQTTSRPSRSNSTVTQLAYPGGRADVQPLFVSLARFFHSRSRPHFISLIDLTTAANAEAENGVTPSVLTD